VLSLSTDSLAAGAPVAPAAGAPPPSNVPRAHGDDRFDRIFKTLSGDAESPSADAAAGDAAANTGAVNAAVADAAGATKCSNDAGKGRASLSAFFLKSGTSRESGKSQESGESQESGKSGETGKSQASDESGKSEKPSATNTAIFVNPVPVTIVPQPIADPAILSALANGSAGDADESGQPATNLPVDADSAGRSNARQGQADGRMPSTGTRAAAAPALDQQASLTEGTGRFNAVDSSINTDGGAEAAGTGADAAAQATEATSRRSPRNQPTPAELRVSAGITNDLRAAIRAAAGNTTTGGQDAGASADRGSRGASSASAQASHAAAPASDVKAAVDAMQTAARTAGTISPELIAAPHLQTVVRSASLEAAAAMALDRDGASVSSQVIESIRLQWAKGGGDAQMTLQPGYLGGLSVSLRVDKDVVTASVIAESPAVREWLRANESSLRQGLVDVGLRLEKFQVSDLSAQTPSRDTEARERPSGRDRQSAPRQPRPSRSDSTFEVIAE